MNNELEVWTAEKLKVIKEQIAPKATDAELEYFAAVCRRTGLDPAARQIYCLHRMTYNPDTKKKEPKMSIQTSIDGLRVIAERSRDYGGTTDAEWCGANGKWVDVWLPDQPPAAARIGVWRSAFRQPLVRTALWTEYRQGFQNEGGSFKLTGQWASMPALMLAKCAEALALRAAFPNDMSGLYTSDEMGQADNDRGSGASTRKGEGRVLAAAPTPDPPQLPPAGVDASTGEILSPLREAQATATAQRRTFQPPSQSAQNSTRIMQGFADADAVKATEALKVRIAALDTWEKEQLGEDWRAVGLPSIAGSGKALDVEQLEQATALVDAAETAGLVADAEAPVEG